MKNGLIFAKRNFIEMVRDPLLYIFCAGFPLGMLLMFNIISSFSPNMPLVFTLKSLVPGIMMFSYSLLMLMSALLVSKDKSTSFIRRLFTSPLKSKDFIFGYFIPFFIIGCLQNVICILTGLLIALITNAEYINIINSLLLFLEMIPIMVTNIMVGIMLGTIMNDKSAPGICSIFISGCGILGGAWMPIDTMGDFEKIVSFLPFYPSVYLGRIITKASCSIPNEKGEFPLYSFNNNGVFFICNIIFYLVLSIILTILVFNKKMEEK